MAALSYGGPSPLPPSVIFWDINFAGKTFIEDLSFGLRVKFGANLFTNGRITTE